MEEEFGSTKYGIHRVSKWIEATILIAFPWRSSFCYCRQPPRLHSPPDRSHSSDTERKHLRGCSHKFE